MEMEVIILDINYILYFVIGYLFGSIPFALIIGKVFHNIDIRNHGSGNLGGTNAGRVLGRQSGIAVMALDVLKAIIPVLVIVGLGNMNYAIIAGFGITVGHCYPLFANFRGGKAVSTVYGFIGACTLSNLAQLTWLLLLPLFIFFAITKTTKYVSLGAMSSLGIANILSYFVQANILLSISITILWVFVVFRHIPNIKNLLNKNERKVKW